VPTLRWYANSYQKRAGIQVQLETINLEERLEPETETVLYRVAQEALTNAARHAQASTVVIRLERTRTSVTALIGDDGVGLDDTQPSAAEGAQRGAGLLGIRERVASRNGTFRIESQPGKGTTLIVEMPLTQDVDSASS
jgi:two-component system sensor histidine kinase UhpB